MVEMLITVAEDEKVMEVEVEVVRVEIMRCQDRVYRLTSMTDGGMYRLISKRMKYASFADVGYNRSLRFPPGHSGDGFVVLTFRLVVLIVER
jgi:hypothetical protein